MMLRDGTAELDPRHGTPGWIEPPGSSGYRLARRRGLKRAFLWILAIMALLLLFSWPYIKYSMTERAVNVALHGPRR